MVNHITKFNFPIYTKKSMNKSLDNIDQQQLSSFVFYTDYYDASILSEPKITTLIVYYKIHTNLGLFTILEINTDYSYVLYFGYYAKIPSLKNNHDKNILFFDFLNNPKIKKLNTKNKILKKDLCLEIKNFYNQRNKLKSNKFEFCMFFRKFIFHFDKNEFIIDLDLLDPLPILHKNCITNIDEFVKKFIVI